MNMKILFACLVAALVLLSGCAQYQSEASVQGEQNTAVGAQENQAPADTTPSNSAGTSAKGELEVTVTGPDGNPVENAVVEIFAGDSSDAPKIGMKNTDSSGKVTFENVTSGEIYVAAADAQNVFAANSGEIDIEGGETAGISVRLQTRVEPAQSSPSPDAVSFMLESDDKGFYQDGNKVSEIMVPKGATVNLTINQRTQNSVWGGADIRSSAFETFNVPNGKDGTISFTVDSAVKVSSFWPGSKSKKSDVTFTPQ
ncbi:MAG TPA: carboxypeptidase-like regulatory domain-containing protein [archaeon]|nr:carboxypeptidase-like regulatory domain-containing protein [archaeon]